MFSVVIVPEDCSLSFCTVTSAGEESMPSGFPTPSPDMMESSRSLFAASVKERPKNEDMNTLSERSSSVA